MIDKITYSKEHIYKIKKQYSHLDQFIIERTIFAFGLLEALVRVDMPFVFKGGTSLILLLDKPYRLSTDIDIIVDPKVNIEPYLDKASKIFPFIEREEQTRLGKNDIIKKHYKFYYKSPSTEEKIPILLDVLYEKHGYSGLIKKKIENNLLETSGMMLEVAVPTIESILGDKLTAFAPHTTGIEYEYYNKSNVLITKYLEVSKQFLDVSKLVQEAKNFKEIRESYMNVVIQEINYRGLSIKPVDVLRDTFNVALSIVSKGSFYKDDYLRLIDGTRRIQNHVFGIVVNGESIISLAADIMLITAQLSDNVEFVEIVDMPLFKSREYKTIDAIKKIDPQTFNKIATAIKLFKILS